MAKDKVDLNIDDYEFIIKVMQQIRTTHQELYDQAISENIFQSKIDKQKGNINRGCRIEEWAMNEVRRIRGEKFERFRLSKKYWKGVCARSAKLKVED